MDDIDTAYLDDLVRAGRDALNGDSNDAEHDALYAIVEYLYDGPPYDEEEEETDDSEPQPGTDEYAHKYPLREDVRQAEMWGGTE